MSMMKFKGHYDQNPEWDVDLDNPLRAQMWPTVDEFNEVMRHEDNDTIKQILRGEGLYFGYECERFADNKINYVESPAIINNQFKAHIPKQTRAIDNYITIPKGQLNRKMYYVLRANGYSKIDAISKLKLILGNEHD